MRTTKRGARRWCRRGARWTSAQRFAWNKLLTGEFRVGVSQSLVVRAIAETSGVTTEVIAHRLMGDWQPTPEFWQQLVAPETRDADVSRPYPFFLAYPLEGDGRRAGRPRRMAGRVEVGRHSRAADPPRSGGRSSGRAARS